MANFLTAQNLIVARLEAKIAAADWTGKKKPRVLTARDAEEIEERSQVVPAIYVVFDGFQPVGETNSGAVATLESTWIITAAVRSARDHQSGDGVRADAIELVDLILDAMLGWRPSKDFMPARPAPTPKPGYSDAGFGYFPAVFTIRTVARGSVT